jgi:serine/threonine-protein kinase CHEK2
MDRVLTRAFQASQGEPELDHKKPRRSSRISSQRQDNGDPSKTPVNTQQQLPSPVTHTHLTSEETSQLFKEATATPPEGRFSQIPHSQTQAFSSPPQDTQAFPSQYIDPNAALSDEVEDEVKEGVWGYLFPLDTRYGGRCIVMRKRAVCPLPDTVAEATKKNGLKGKDSKGKEALLRQEESYETTKITGPSSGGYLIGRHPECGE